MDHKYQNICIPPPAVAPAPGPQLDARLRAAAELVRGGVVADVGTDHAYLPIALLLSGQCDFAVATDIHRGPAEVAAAHLSACGIGGGRAAVLLTDGLHGAEKYAPRDICILGMGGEMIVHILEEAPWVRDPAIRLILQPMTKPEVLRDYLDRVGFAIRQEVLVKTDRIYQLLCAEYDGRLRDHSPLELLIGAQNLARRDGATLELVRRQQAILSAARAGKAKGSGADTTKEDALLSSIDQYLNDTEVTP